MKSPLSLACALLFALTPIAARSATVYYAPPAGTLPAGRYHGLDYNAVLPSGRLVTPVGTSVVTGMNALGLTLTPDGRYAIVSNDSDAGADQHNSLDPTATGGYSLAVIDTTTMSVASRYRAPNTPYFVGLLAVPDPQAPARTLVLASGGAADVVYALTLDANGVLHPARRPLIQIPPPGGAMFANATESGPATLLAAGDGRHAYVVDELGGTVASIDLGTLTVVGVPEACGDFPIGAAVAGSRLLVTNEGLMRYGIVPTRQVAPPFMPLAPDPAASSLALFAANGTALDDPPSLLPMDPTPDGLRIVGGAHPSAVVATPDGNYAYVAMTNVDRIATVELSGIPHVAGGTELRLFDRGPYGTEPSALALSRDGTRLYVALAGLNAVAVIDARDPLHLHRLGLIPAGWLPTALALAPDDRSLLVLNQKGYGNAGGAVWSTLQRIDLAAVQLANTTRATLAATRVVVSTSPAPPHAIKNVVVILTEHRTFDSVFGDLAWGPADPGFVQFGAAITPNLHALAQRFALAGNMFADGSDGVASHHQLTSGLATSFTERTAVLGGDETLLGANEDPEDMPRMGSIFDALARHRISFRDYGELVRVAGYRASAAPDPTAGLGGSYGFDVPAPVTLSGHVDQAYPGWNTSIPDTVRAREFMRDYGALAAKHRVPRFAYVWLPNSATPAAAADNDRALGAIVARLSRLPSWRSTAIFVVADDARFGADHIDGSRTFALVISPYARAHYVGMRHLSTASVLKSLDGIFGLPPLSLGDLLANDMSDFFTTTRANVRPYTAAAPGSP